ncbi:GatB/YqeY domain-containing protein [Streptosporangium amethystogenes subsp. fukuiense]
MDRMSALKDKLKADLTASMKSRDEIRTRTIRMALAAVNVEEVSGKAARELSDDEIVKVLAKEAKKRREAAEAFSGAGRAEQAQAEIDEQAVLEAYLPAQLSDEELAVLVDEAVAESGASGPQAMGQVMKIVNPKVAGRAEGGRVAQAVRARLASS